jgi:Ca2+-binding RTX toxin-like protein
LTTEPDGSVAALVYDFDANSQTYHYSLWKFTGLDGMETSSRRISIPQPWALAFEMGSDADGKLIVTGEDTQALWYAQRYSLSGDVDPYYGKTEDVFDAPTPVARPSIQGPNQFVSGDAAVLPDGAVVFANTRDRIGKPHDLVIAKVEGGAGAPADVKLNAKGTLIFKGTPVADHVGITLRNRDGKLIVRADDYVKSFAPSRVKRIAVFGNDGDDVLTIGPGVRGGYLEGDNGDDTLTGGDNADILFGGPGADLISGGLARDKIFGDDGNDVLNGNGGNDYILGGAGNDDLFGNGNDDTLSGAGGNDRLYGGGGADVLLGGDGSDAAPEDPLDSRDSIETILT